MSITSCHKEDGENIVYDFGGPKANYSNLGLDGISKKVITIVHVKENSAD